MSRNRKLGRLWFRYSVEEIFREAVIGRNGRKRTKSTRPKHYALLAAVILSAGQLLVDLYRLVRGHRIAPLPCLNTDGSGRLTSLTVGSLPA